MFFERRALGAWRGEYRKFRMEEGTSVTGFLGLINPLTRQIAVGRGSKPTGPTAAARRRPYA